MSGAIVARRANWKVFGILALVAAMIAVLTPTVAEGSDSGDPVLGGDPSVVYLTLGRTDEVTWDTLSQSITTRRNDCTAISFATSDDLLNVTAFGGVLGESRDSIGVQSAGDGSGEPCARIETEDGEAISVSLASDLDKYLMTAVDVDLEFKFGGVVGVEFYHNGTKVAEDAFDPTDASDDGPDSRDGDNFRYDHRPLDGEGAQIYFDTVKFIPTSGSFSLEGGADGTDNGTLDAANNSSQFQVIRTFDGELGCFPGDDASIGTAGTDTTYGTVRLRSMDLLDSDVWANIECPKKPYDSDTDLAALSFVPEAPADFPDARARYTIEVTVENQPITQSVGITGVPDGTITSLIAVYDPTGEISFPAMSELPLLACLGQPVLVDADSDPENTLDPYDAFWIGTGPDDIMPSDETACFYAASVTPTGDSIGTEHWSILFLDDPGFRFK